MKLNQIAANDAVTSEIVSLIEQSSTLLRNHVEFFTGPGLGSTERKSNLDANPISSRNINSNYTGQTVAPTYFPVGRKIFGDVARMDVVYERLGYNLPSEMRSQLRRFVNPIVNGFQNLLINGNVATSAVQFNGLKVLTPASQIINAGTNGLTVTMGNSDVAKTSQQNFLEKLDLTIATAKGLNKVIVCNAIAKARLNTIAREWLTYTTDTFGQQITLYNGMPIVNIEELGGSIIPQNETLGTATTCSSIYVVSFGERESFSFFTAPDGMMVYPVQKNGNFYECTLEFVVDSALFNEKAVSRLQGLMF